MTSSYFLKPARLFSTLTAFMELYSVELIYKARAFRMFKYLPVFPTKSQIAGEPKEWGFLVLVFSLFFFFAKYMICKI